EVLVDRKRGPWVVSEDPTVAGLSAVNYGQGSGYPGGAPGPRVARSLKSRKSTADRLFRLVLSSGGSVALLIMIGVGSSLTFTAWQALHKAGWSFLTTQTWNANGGQFGIAAVLVGTALIALVAVGVAMVLATGTALYISEY